MAELIIIQLCLDNYIGEPYHHAKFHYDPFKAVPFGGPVDDAPHLGGQIPKNRSKKGMNRQFPAKSQKSLNFDIFKTRPTSHRY